MIIDFIIEDLMLNSYLQKNFHTLIFCYKPCIFRDYTTFSKKKAMTSLFVSIL